MFILYIVIAVSFTSERGGANGVTALTHEHHTSASCEAAKNAIREHLSAGKVLLAMCTPK